MRLEVLGFRVAAPLGAACSGYVVQSGTTTLLLDCGPGVLERLWARGLAERLDAIVISHMHMDHMLDLLPLSGEITQMLLDERRPERPRPALWLPRGRGPQALAMAAESVRSSYERFEEAFELGEYDDAGQVEAGDLRLTFAVTAHDRPCYAARVTDGRSTLVYSADGAVSDALLELAADADLALFEATSPGADMDGHMTGAQAAELARRAGARRLLLTHLGPWPNDENLRRARERFAEAELVAEGAVYEVG